MRRTLSAVALCGLLAGCGGPNKMYQPAAGWTQTQTAEAAYWDCTGQSWQNALGNPATWIPVPVAQDISAHDTMAFINACMAQKGWAQRAW